MSAHPRPTGFPPRPEATVPLRDLNDQCARVRVNNRDETASVFRWQRTNPRRTAGSQDGLRQGQGGPREEPEHALLILWLAEQRQPAPERRVVQIDTRQRVPEESVATLTQGTDWRTLLVHGVVDVAEVRTRVRSCTSHVETSTQRAPASRNARTRWSCCSGVVRAVMTTISA